MNWLRAYRPGLFEQLDGRIDLKRLQVPDFRPGPREEVERRELADAVLDAVGSLPPKYRVPLTMFHLDGLSYRKVADFLDIPLGTAKSLIHRAREQLRPALGAYLAEEVTPMVKEVFDEHRLPERFAERIIDGLEQSRWGAGERENSVIGSLAVAFQAIGEDVSYEHLMGVSGAAFRLQMHHPGWCPSAPHANCGFNCYQAALDALDYEVVEYPALKDDEASVDRARRALVESIDGGRPVFHQWEEQSLVVGYKNEAHELLMRLYAANEPGYRTVKLDEIVSDWGGFGVLRKKEGSAPARRATLIRSLELALELAHAPSFDKHTSGELTNRENFETYLSGFAAYAFWIESLRQGERFADPVQLAHDMHANAHCYYSLCDAREAAAAYLRAIAPEFDGKARVHLEHAAELYQELFSEVLTERCPTELAPMPWFLKDKAAWTQELRDEQAQVLERAVPLEQRALAEIAAALASVS